MLVCFVSQTFGMQRLQQGQVAVTKLAENVNFSEKLKQLKIEMLKLSNTIDALPIHKSLDIKITKLIAEYARLESIKIYLESELESLHNTVETAKKLNSPMCQQVLHIEELNVHRLSCTIARMKSKMAIIQTIIDLIDFIEEPISCLKEHIDRLNREINSYQIFDENNLIAFCDRTEASSMVIKGDIAAIEDEISAIEYRYNLWEDKKNFEQKTFFVRYRNMAKALCVGAVICGTLATFFYKTYRSVHA